MSHIYWDSKYSVDNGLIDSEHRQLFDLINTLDDAINSDDPLAEYQIICNAANALMTYVQTHFAHEEDLMRDSSYPYLTQHQEEHQNLLKLSSYYNDALGAGGSPVSARELWAITHEWLTEHILDSDMKYVPYLVRG